MKSLKKTWRLFRPIPVTKLLQEELMEARREFLKAETAKEYADSIVQYNAQRIARIKQRMAEANTEEI
ncbi:hypothetical protein UFOVP273_90 [uncultured Caudovirales phage]|uniref:Uncharacterized protein n=1 Tax=uncultured Caudovirales phage TaxID=2100421 RepID=A0A6J5LJV0_9CAUD|nr:hypothetical protein UFOVP273_90 [uncultured Caudovirales phage]